MPIPFDKIEETIRTHTETAELLTDLSREALKVPALSARIDALTAQNTKLAERVSELEQKVPPPSNTTPAPGDPSGPLPSPAIITRTLDDVDGGLVIDAKGLHHKRIFVRDRHGIQCEPGINAHIAACEFVFTPAASNVQPIHLSNPRQVRIERVLSRQTLSSNEAYAPLEKNQHIKIEGASRVVVEDFQFAGGTKGIEIRASESRPLEEWRLSRGVIENTRDVYNADWPIEGHCIQVMSTHPDRDPPWLRTSNAPAANGLVENVSCSRDALRYAGADDMNFYHCGRVEVRDCAFDGQNQRSAAFVQFERCLEGDVHHCKSRRAHQTGFSAAGTKHVRMGHLWVQDRFDRDVVLDQKASGLPHLPAYLIRSYRGSSIESFEQTGPLYADDGRFLVDAYAPGHELHIERI